MNEVMPLPQNLAGRLRAVRREKCLTQEDVAYRAGCSVELVKFIEDGLIVYPR